MTPMTPKDPGCLGGESSGYQRRGRHSGMAWLDSALFAHGLDGDRLRQRQPRHKTAGQNMVILGELGQIIAQLTREM